MSTVYCGSCGAALSETAKFCRDCGSAQDAFATPAAPLAAAPLPVAATPPFAATPPVAPLPAPPFTEPPPPPPPAPGLAPPAARGSVTGIDLVAATLAIAGGAGMCFMVLYTIVYLPLHEGSSVNFGESLQFGDLLALASGALAVVLGSLALRRAPANPVGTGIALVLAGLPTLILALLWSFPSTFHLSLYPEPFYIGFVYFSSLGVIHLGSHFLQLPLLVATAAVIAAGLIAATGSRGAPAGFPQR